MSNKISYEERCQVYEAALNKFGMDTQMIIAIEEMSEVVKAITKLMRINSPEHKAGEFLACLDALAEEVADATIMLEQLRLIFVINDEVCQAMDAKIERLKERVGENATHNNI